MPLQLHCTNTEETYLAFNYFHALESNDGQKQLRKTRFLFVGLMSLMIVLFLVIMGVTTTFAVYAIALACFTLVYALCLKKVVKRNIDLTVKRLKKLGKLPITPEFTLEFYEDRLVEISPGKRVEESYSAIERVCWVKGRFVLLYNSSASAYIIPEHQIEDLTAFLEFLTQTFSEVEHY